MIVKTRLKILGGIGILTVLVFILVYFSCESSIIEPELKTITINLMDNEADGTLGNIGNLPNLKESVKVESTIALPEKQYSKLQSKEQYFIEMKRKHKDLNEDWVWVKNPKLYYEEYLKKYNKYFQEQ